MFYDFIYLAKGFLMRPKVNLKKCSVRLLSYTLMSKHLVETDVKMTSKSSYWHHARGLSYTPSRKTTFPSSGRLHGNSSRVCKNKVCQYSNVSKTCRWNGKQCRPWSDWSFRSSLISVNTDCPLQYPSHGCKSNLSRDMSKLTKWVCTQQRLRSAWASAQLSDQSLPCLHEESLGP